MIKVLLLIAAIAFQTIAQPRLEHADRSPARQWMEELLLSIRSAQARPPIHSRNLLALSAAMFNAFALYRPNGADALLLWPAAVPRPAPAACDDGGEALRCDAEAQAEAVHVAAAAVLVRRFNDTRTSIRVRRRLGLSGRRGIPPDATRCDAVARRPRGGSIDIGCAVALAVLQYQTDDGSCESDDFMCASRLARSTVILFTSPSPSFRP